MSLPQRPATDPLRTDWDSDFVNPIRKLAFLFGLAYIWVRYSLMHEMITYLTGVNLKFVYLLAPPVFIGVILSGGIKRTLRERPAWYWLALTGWMILAIPFSSWKGGSVDVVLGFLKSQIGLLFVLGGLAMSWKECKSIMYTLALGLVFLVFTGRFFLHEEDSVRLEGFGTMANSNDYAALLLLLLPFVLFVALGPKQKAILRVFAMAAAAYSLYQVLATGSRGAVVALAVTAVFVLWRGQRIYRVATVLLLPIAALTVLALLPTATVSRLMSFTPEESELEAYQSTLSREYLLRQSLRFTFQHPVFGVGPGQFLNYEGKLSVEQGQRGAWHSTHNLFTQVSSEYGIPGMILLVAMLIGTFRLFDEALREARRRQLQDVEFAVFCMMVSFVAFTAAATFLNLAYGFYFPAFTGLAVTVFSAVRMDPQLAGRAAGGGMMSPPFARFAGGRMPFFNGRLNGRARNVSNDLTPAGATQGQGRQTALVNQRSYVRNRASSTRRQS